MAFLKLVNNVIAEPLQNVQVIAVMQQLANCFQQLSVLPAHVVPIVSLSQDQLYVERQLMNATCQNIVAEILTYVQPMFINNQVSAAVIIQHIATMEHVSILVVSAVYIGDLQEEQQIASVGVTLTL